MYTISRRGTQDPARHRAHESNLKKQGVLALAFRAPADYDEIREDDRLSLVGLGDLAPGVDVGGILRHADGSTARLRLRHSYTTAQIAWFTRGAALNLLTTT
jgi:aconitate hydratase